MISPFKKYAVDLFGEKQKFMDAAMKNLEYSNEMSRRFQTLIATIILAQLAFLGTLGFNHTHKILAATAATLLVIALLVHLIAASWQQTGVVKSAKHYIKKAGGVDQIIKETKKKHIDPDDYAKYDIVNSASTIGFTKWPNRLMLAAYAFGLIGTLAVLMLIWRVVLC